jgi:hypothetical protein
VPRYSDKAPRSVGPLPNEPSPTRPRHGAASGEADDAGSTKVIAIRSSRRARVPGQDGAPGARLVTADSVDGAVRSSDDRPRTDDADGPAVLLPAEPLVLAPAAAGALLRLLRRVHHRRAAAVAGSTALSTLRTAHDDTRRRAA